MIKLNNTTLFLWFIILFSINTTSFATENMTETPKGILSIIPSHANVYAPDRIHDGSASSFWLSRTYTHNNTFEFTFDPNLNSITGEIADQFTLDSIALFSPGNSKSVKEFVLEVQSNGGAWQRLYSSQDTATPYNFAKAVSGGALSISPSYINVYEPSRAHDGSAKSYWLSNTFNNTFEFTFDPDLNGTAGEVADQFTLDSIALFSPGNTSSVKEFVLEAQSNGGVWQRLYSPQVTANPYNFAKAVSGGLLSNGPSYYGSSSPERIHDGSSKTSWQGVYGSHNNIFEFTFDPNLNGTAGEVADQFTLDSIVLFSPGNTSSIKDFEITVKTSSGWQAPIYYTALQTSAEQSFSIGPFNNVVQLKLTTLNNYGANDQRINEFEVRGVWLGNNPIFKASQIAGEQAFDLTAATANNDGRINNITGLRLQTVSNYGANDQRINEIEARGVWLGNNPIFKASQIAGEQAFDLTAATANNDGRTNNITRLKLQTIENFGSAHTQINEFEVRGVWSGKNPIFTASQTTGEQAFDLASNFFNNDGRRSDITRLKLQTIENFGDRYLQINEFQAFGIINKRLTGGFNAFDSATALTAISGSLQTRIASNNTINFDVIALNTDKSAVDTSFTNDVKVELLANMASVASDSNNCPVSSTVISTLAATTIINGRSTVAMPAVNNVWKDVAIRITYQPPTGALITTCAIDRFAIRPAAFTLIAQHNDWQTAGNNEAINTVSSNASPIHKAGRMFSLQIKAVDSAGTIMSNYADIPVIASNYPSLLSPTTGVLGTLELGSLTNVKGVIDSHTAKYSEVGAITLKMIDEDFAGVDASDGTSLSARTISSAEAIIGRFIPDHFKVTTVTNGMFENACSGFSYNGQSFSYQTAPEINVSAYNSDNVITQNYTGNFAKLTVNDFSISVANHDAIQLGKDGVNLIRINRNAAPVSLNDNSDGSLSFSFGNDLFTHLHDNNSLVAPYSNTLNINITSITDSDGVTTQSLPHLLQVTGGNIRFGKLVINTAHGSELLPLPVTIKTEYFNGIDWTQNTADQCTVLIPNAHLRLANPETRGGSWQAGDSTMTIANGTSTASFQQITSGQGILTFSAPGEDNYGFINIKGNLSGTYDWLLADTNNDGVYDDPATARASFGVFKGSDTIIFKRELY